MNVIFINVLFDDLDAKPISDGFVDLEKASGNLIIEDFSSVFDSADVMELKCIDGMRTSVFSIFHMIMICGELNLSRSKTNKTQSPFIPSLRDAQEGGFPAFKLNSVRR